MIRIQSAGIEAFVPQAIWSQDYENTLICISIAGREMAVRALVAQFLTSKSLPIEINGEKVYVSKGTQTFTMKGQKISKQHFQTVLWNKEEQPNVITRADFGKLIEGRYTTPIHPSWEDTLWRRGLDLETIEYLDSYGTDTKYFLSRLREETLQSMILENLDSLKSIMKN